MEKIFNDLMTATDEQDLLNTTLKERCNAYNRVVQSLKFVLTAQKLCTDARERGEGTPVLDRVESLLQAALNG